MMNFLKKFWERHPEYPKAESGFKVRSLSGRVEKKKMSGQVLRVFFYSILIVCSVALTLKSAFADPPAGANPEGVSGYPNVVPVEVLTEQGCTLSSCPHVIWYAADIYDSFGGSLQFANATCISLMETVGESAEIVRYESNDWLYFQTGEAVDNNVRGVSCTQNDGISWEAASTKIKVGPFSDYIATNVNIRAGETWAGTTYSPSGFTEGDLILGSNYVSGILSVTATGSTTIQEGGSVVFHASWTNVGFSPYYLFFYEDAEDFGTNNYEQIVNFFPLGGSGTYNFNHVYDIPSYPDSYLATIALGNQYCVTPTSSGCVLVDSGMNGSSITVMSEQDYDFDSLFPSTLTGGLIDIGFGFTREVSEAKVGQTVRFLWNVNSSVCAPSDIFNVYFKYGYNNASEEPNFGSGVYVGDGSNGTLNLPILYSNQPDSDFIYPRLEVNCVGGTLPYTLYLGGTWNIGKAGGFAVYEGDIPFAVPQSFNNGNYNGGFSIDYLSGSGGIFLASDKLQYKINEPVTLRLEYYADLGFDVSTIRVSPNSLNPSNRVFIFTGSVLGSFGSGKSIYLKYFYNASGYYDPLVELRSSTYSIGDPSTYERLYLGGNTFKQPKFTITVLASSWGSVGGVNNGNSTTSPVCPLGIFGFTSSTFQVNFLTSYDNLFWAFAQGVINSIMDAIFFTVRQTYCLVLKTPVMNDFILAIHPPKNVDYILPTQIFGYSVPMVQDFSDYHFTIAYADEVGFKNFSTLVRYVVFVVIFLFVLKAII